LANLLYRDLLVAFPFLFIYPFLSGCSCKKRPGKAMAHKARKELVIAVSPQVAWEAVKDFQNVNWLQPAGGQPAAQPNSAAKKRSLTLNNGNEVVEELVKGEEGDKEKVLVWTIVKTSLPVTNWEGRLTVTPVGRTRSRISFECTFDSADPQMKNLFINLYEEGFAKIKLSFEG
jgi:hypothetical protein